MGVITVMGATSFQDWLKAEPVDNGVVGYLTVLISRNTDSGNTDSGINQEKFSLG